MEGGKTSSLSGDILQYLRDLYKKKRTPASHVMVFLLSDEHRDKKPYGIPVRIVPYSSLKDDQMRQWKEEIRAAMDGLGMKYIGMNFMNVVVSAINIL